MTADARTRRLRALIASWTSESAICRNSAESSEFYQGEDAGYAAAYAECADELKAVLDTEGDRQPPLSDAHVWELERFLTKLRVDDPGNFPLIQALEAAVNTAPNLRTMPLVGEQQDEELLPHAFLSREGNEIWCQHCEYHQDHRIHRAVQP